MPSRTFDITVDELNALGAGSGLRKLLFSVYNVKSGIAPERTLTPGQTLSVWLYEMLVRGGTFEDGQVLEIVRLFSEYLDKLADAFWEGMNEPGGKFHLVSLVIDDQRFVYLTNGPQKALDLTLMELVGRRPLPLMSLSFVLPTIFQSVVTAALERRTAHEPAVETPSVAALKPAEL